MTLTHDGYTFGGHRHTSVTPETMYELPIRIVRFAGSRAELHLIDETKGRDLSSVLTADGYATLALLEAGLQTLYGKAGTLTGPLTDGSATFAKCTFLGGEPIEPPFLDGSGANGWVQRIRLRWRQRDRS